MIKNIAITLGFALCLSACANSAKLTTPAGKKQHSGSVVGTTNKLKTNRPHSEQRLNNVYRQWNGTRYRIGGKTKRGIDCSAFMQVTFLEAYGMNLPRSTAEQRHLGKRIEKHQLQKGDLVFFRKNHHVGVYIGNNQFMHASSSQGVTISSLNEDYWRRTYTQSRRIR